MGRDVEVLKSKSKDYDEREFWIWHKTLLELIHKQNDSV